MNCAKCGLELPSNVKTCPKCGLINEFISPEPAPRKTKPVIYVIAALGTIALLALVLAVIAGRGNKSVTSAPGPIPGPPGNITTAPPPAPSGGGLMTAPPPGPGAGNTTPPGAAHPKPSQAVLEYLDFVKKVEEHRQMLLRDTADALMITAVSGQAQSLMDLIDMASDPDGAKARDPLSDAKKELGRQYKNWLSTLKYLDGRPAPPECREFGGAYRAVIYSEVKAIGDIAVNFNSVDVSDPRDMSGLLQALMKMKGDPSIQGDIDKSADNADAKLSQLASYYGMEKPFDVPREKKTSGSIMGF